MKLTKTQLKQIIREEINNVVKEWTIGGFGTGNTELFDKLRQESRALQDAIKDARRDPNSTSRTLANFRASAWALWSEAKRNKKTFNDKQWKSLEMRLDPESSTSEHNWGLEKLRNDIEYHEAGVAKAAADEKAAKDAAEREQWKKYYARKRAEEDKEEYERKTGSRPGRAGHIAMPDGTFVNP
jgi:septal ring factor EnvC (AmiA/AmiB activator)